MACGEPSGVNKNCIICGLLVLLVRGEKNVGLVPRCGPSSIQPAAPLLEWTLGMERMDWYPKNPIDYREDTYHLTLAEHGAYNLLIDHYMNTERPLPSHDKALASILGIPLEEWLDVSENVTLMFRRVSNALRHKRCDLEIEKSYTKRRDGKERQIKFRNALKGKERVTRDKRVSNAATGEDRTGQEKEESILISFEFFWSVYPRKVGKKKSEDAYRKAIGSFPDLEDMDAATILVDAAIKYAEVTTDIKFCKHPATWLNGECWDDVIEHVQPEASTPGSKMKKAFDDLKDENANRSNIVELKP